MFRAGSWDDVFKVAVVLYIIGTLVWNLFSTGEKVLDQTIDQKQGWKEEVLHIKVQRGKLYRDGKNIRKPPKKEKSKQKENLLRKLG